MESFRTEVDSDQLLTRLIESLVYARRREGALSSSYLENRGVERTRVEAQYMVWKKLGEIALPTIKFMSGNSSEDERFPSLDEVEEYHFSDKLSRDKLKYKMKNR